MPSLSAFGVALTKARVATGLSQTSLAHELGRLPNSVYRWERQATMPSMEVRIELLQALRSAPRPLLEALASEANVTLEAIGIRAPAAPTPAVLAPVAAAPSPPPPPPIPATAQATVDDAVREAAEELDLSAKALRPVLSRMLDRLARGGVPIDAAARMVLGVPKKPEASPDPTATATRKA